MEAYVSGRNQAQGMRHEVIEDCIKNNTPRGTQNNKNEGSKESNPKIHRIGAVYPHQSCFL